jgi:cell division protein FtsB
MFRFLKEWLGAKYKHYKPYLHEARDVRVLGLIGFGVIVLLVSWSGVKAIDTNYRLQKEIAELQQQTALQSLSNTNLKLQNDYYKTDQYLELSARQNFGLAKPGETELIVPRDVALSYTTASASDGKRPTAAAAQPGWQRNFQAWVDFFLHRQ